MCKTLLRPCFWSRRLELTSGTTYESVLSSSFWTKQVKDLMNTGSFISLKLNKKKIGGKSARGPGKYGNFSFFYAVRSAGFIAINGLKPTQTVAPLVYSNRLDL